MPQHPQVSEIWTIKIYFSGTSGRYKTRPVLIIDHDEENELYTIQEITSSPPRNPPSFFDQFKKPLHNWSQYGLDEPS